MAGIIAAEVSRHLVSVGFGALLILAAQAFQAWMDRHGVKAPDSVLVVTLLGWVIIAAALIAGGYVLAGAVEVTPHRYVQ